MVKRLLGTLIAATLLGSSQLVPSTGALGQTVRPNVIVILTDDQRWDTLAAMPTVQTRLIARGVNFSNAFVTNSFCCPSRASILTGDYSHTTGVYTNPPPHGGFTSFDDRSTLATWLNAVGYRTALIGKYMNGYGPQQTSYIPPGWDRWFAFTSADFTGELGNGDYFNYSVSNDGAPLSFGTAASDYSTDVFAARAASFIRTTSAQEPVFLYFAPKAPHTPSTPAPRHANTFSNLAPWRPPNYNEADVSDKPAHIRALPKLSRDAVRRDHYRTLLSADEAIGAILDALRDTGRLANSIVIFTSDNGFGWGEHRWFSKRVPYEESIRVPMVVRYDGLSTTPRTDNRLVVNIDLAPTIAELSGAAAQTTDGRSMVPLLTQSPVQWRQRFLLENLKWTAGEPIPTYCGVRSKNYLYVVYGTGEDELYDLVNDRYQLQNQARNPAFASIRTAMRQQLATLCVPRPPGFNVPLG